MAEGARDLRLIAFKAGPETFVVDIMAVRQIIPYGGSTTVPTAPSFIEGVVIVRNEVIPIIDLRRRLYPAVADEERHPLVLVTHSTAGTIGLKVDAVRRIVNVPREALLPPPPLIRGIRGDLLIALIEHGEEVLLLIDLESVLSGEEKSELSTARGKMLGETTKAEGRRQKVE
ncbi:MAG TPA: chemotaxis protein CheW [Thermoanaerobaculia bacterium]|nr:chemotaxis protein CheW [Thermoanaerobaculia bacterium]